MTTDPATRNPTPSITLFTVGFAGKSAKEFFETLKKSGVRRLVDIRLNNVSQLAGFTKKRDLDYFLRVIADIDYVHERDLAPTKEILVDYKKKRIDWNEYEIRYRRLIEERKPANNLKSEDFDCSCLLCSEPTPEHCHRRLAAEYLKEAWENVTIVHL
ncbi:MAG: DUF488 domain-containing protein [Thermoguttaceae bacterium]|jgi:uncharacterized protein (DUF488 family)